MHHQHRPLKRRLGYGNRSFPAVFICGQFFLEKDLERLRERGELRQKMVDMGLREDVENEDGTWTDGDFWR